MASNVGIEPALLEMARGMTVESIPEKLRCATCDKLAIGAVKIPCCDSTICTYCHADLSDTECPICTHSPFTASLCLPAKGLQATVKAFIKTEARKRAAETAAALKLAGKAPEAENIEEEKTVPSIEPQQASVAAGQDDIDSQTVQASHEPVSEVKPTEQDDEIQQHEKAPDAEADQDGEEDEEEEEEDIVITTERPDNEQHMSNGNGEQSYNNSMQSQNVQDQGSEHMNGQMPFQDNFNGMMGMNGMDPSQMNFMPNMMGMPGMNFGMGMGMNPGNMDPSMMFGNFGGMGMNDMQSMMQMMGMNGMGDMSQFGGGMGGGGPGFFPSQGNYNMQSNFNGNNQHNQGPFFNNDFNQGRGRPYGRGFGRGRGGQYNRGRGRGAGFGYGHDQQFGHQAQQPYSQGGYDQGGFQQQQQYDAHDEQTDMPPRRASPSYGAASGDRDMSVAEARPGQGGSERAQSTKGVDADEAGQNTNDAGGAVVDHDVAQEHDEQMHNGHGPASDFPEQNHDIHGDGTTQGQQYGDFAPHEEQYQNYNMQYQDQNGHNGMGRGNFRGGYGRGRGGYNSFYARDQDNTELTPKPAPPLNAPTGPKALREGRPNTGWSGLRGGHNAQRPVSRAVSNPAGSEHVDKGHGEPDRESENQTSRSNRAHDDSRDDARSGSRSRSRARSGRNRDRSQSAEEESEESYARRKDRERERRKRKERSRRHEDDEYARGKDEDEPRRKHRSRSETPVEDSSHRRRRDKADDHRSSRSQRDRSKDKHKRRHRSRSPDREDADKHDDYGSSSRRKAKSHRDEDQYESRDKDSRSSRKHSRRDEEEYADDKHGHSHRSSRNDDRDRDSKRSGRHRESESLRAVIEPPSDELGFKIKGSKSAKSGARTDREPRSSHQEVASSDPYAEERARAQQNRVAAEAQRRQSSSLGKHGRGDEIIDAPTGPRGMTNSSSSRSKKVRKETRQINYKYEDEIGEDERDAGRWR